MLAFVGKIESETTITVDGYTSNKTIKGIIRDVARAIEKYDKAEAESLRKYLTDYDAECNTPFVKAKDSCGGYFFEIEEYQGASSYNEETDEVEYKEGYNTYFCYRFVK